MGCDRYEAASFTSSFVLFDRLNKFSTADVSKVEYAFPTLGDMSTHRILTCLLCKTELVLAHTLSMITRGGCETARITTVISLCLVEARALVLV